MCCQGIEKRKTRFYRKPIAASAAEAQQMIVLSNDANVKVQVGHVERFNPAFTAAVNFIDNPMFIETHRLAQFNPRGTDVPVILDLMIHDIDIVLSVVKSKVSKISASGVKVVSDTPDIANARIEFENGKWNHNELRQIQKILSHAHDCSFINFTPQISSSCLVRYLLRLPTTVSTLLFQTRPIFLQKILQD